MFELSVAITITALICSIVFSWNENAKRSLIKEARTASNKEHGDRQQEIERLCLQSHEDIRVLRTQLADLKTDVSSVKVSLGWSKD
jgi:hypothetical protein